MKFVEMKNQSEKPVLVNLDNIDSIEATGPDELTCNIFFRGADQPLIVSNSLQAIRECIPMPASFEEDDLL